MEQATEPLSLKQISEKIISKWVKINISIRLSGDLEDISDMVVNHSIDFLTLSLLWYGFHDSVKEGTETEFYDIGSCCCLCSNKKAIITMPKKLLI